MTEKVFAENKNIPRKEVIKQLEDAFQCDFVFLPWDKDEIFGHSDGIIHYIGDNRILMTNYADYNSQMASRFEKILARNFEVIPLSNNAKRKHRRNWAYVNFLQVGSMVFVPQLGIEEDDMALRQITEAMPRHKVVGIPTLEAVRKGGALNCISWNVQTIEWGEGFMGEEYKLEGFTISELIDRANKGKAISQNNLGQCYTYGKGVERNHSKGLVWFKKAAAEGCQVAMYNVGIYYFLGLGIEKDLNEALKWFQKAADKGFCNAQLYIAKCYEQLFYPEYEIFDAYKKAAEMGNAEAQIKIGDMYQEGTHHYIAKDENEGTIWYRKAAEQCHPYAEYLLGECYDFGIGVHKNQREALKWYKRSASFGCEDAQFRIGLCYYFGHTFRRNGQKAVHWFQKAEKHNHPNAQYWLGQCYEDGVGVEKNYEIAIEWYRKAAEHGHTKAKAKVEAREECPF